MLLCSLMQCFYCMLFHNKVFPGRLFHDKRLGAVSGSSLASRNCTSFGRLRGVANTLSLMNREVWGGVYLKIGRVGAVVLHFVHGRMTVDVQPQLDDSILTSCLGSESKPEAKDCFVDSRYCYDLHRKVHVAVKCGS